MKRGMTGGTHRGPPALRRQRRTIRIVQALLVLIAAGMFMFAGYSYGWSNGYDEGRRSDGVDAARPPSLVQTAVLTVLGLGTLAGAFLLQAGGMPRVPTPARLDELAGRAEATAVERAERHAEAGSERPEAPEPKRAERDEPSERR